MNYTVEAVEKDFRCITGPRSIPSITSVSMLRVALSADRVYRSREIAPRDVDRAPRNLLIIEKVRISGASFLILSSPEIRFSTVSRCDSRARFAPRKRDFEKHVYKRSRSGFILHLWRRVRARARMLFLSKLSPT